MASNIRKRAVVSSFICTPPDSPTGLTFALFKRSQKVNTYQGKWAVCSGSIETTDSSPEVAAQREIQEETTLSGDEIFLLRKGKPFSLTDEKLKTEWTIYPFAWQLKEGAKPITFDWEHTDFKFVKPEEIATMDHVPQLEVGMYRVLVSQETEEALAVLKEPKHRFSGIKQLIIGFLEQSIKTGELSKPKTSEDFWRDLKWKVWHYVENGHANVHTERATFSKILHSTMVALGASSQADIARVSLSELKSATIDALSTAKSLTAERTLANNVTNFLQTQWRFNNKASGSDNKAPIKLLIGPELGAVVYGLAKMLNNLARKGIHVNAGIIDPHSKEDAIQITEPFKEEKNKTEGFINFLIEALKEETGSLRPEIQLDLIPYMTSIREVLPVSDFIIILPLLISPRGDALITNWSSSVSSPRMLPSGVENRPIVAMFETSRIANYNPEWPKKWPSLIKREPHPEHLREAFHGNPSLIWISAGFVSQYITEDGEFKVEDITQWLKDGDECWEGIMSDL